jgi:hypothetical protein
VSGAITGNLDLVWNDKGKLTFDYADLNVSGSLSAFDLDESFKVGATLSGNELAFDVDGYNFGIAL